MDLTYSVSCRRSVGRQWEPCGASVGFVPQQLGLTERTVTVVNLLPNTNYSFAVEALNGVSELLPKKRFYTQVNVSTSLPGEPPHTRLTVSANATRRHAQRSLLSGAESQNRKMSANNM